MTSKEKKLLIGALALLVFVLFWFLAYKPMDNKVKITQSELDILNEELSALSIEYLKKDALLEEIADMTAYIESVDAKFPAFTSQEMIIHTMIDIEDAIDTLSISGYTMTIPASVLSNGEYKDETTGELKYRENLLVTNAPLSLEMSYEDFKKMLT
jgi:hypothetical protein